MNIREMAVEDYHEVMALWNSFSGVGVFWEKQGFVTRDDALYRDLRLD